MGIGAGASAACREGANALADLSETQAGEAEVRFARGDVCARASVGVERVRCAFYPRTNTHDRAAAGDEIGAAHAGEDAADGEHAGSGYDVRAAA